MSSEGTGGGNLQREKESTGPDPEKREDWVIVHEKLRRGWQFFIIGETYKGRRGMDGTQSGIL